MDRVGVGWHGSVVIRPIDLLTETQQGWNSPGWGKEGGNINNILFSLSPHPHFLVFMVLIPLSLLFEPLLLSRGKKTHNLVLLFVGDDSIPSLARRTEVCCWMKNMNNSFCLRSQFSCPVYWDYRCAGWMGEGREKMDSREPETLKWMALGLCKLPWGAESLDWSWRIWWQMGSDKNIFIRTAWLLWNLVHSQMQQGIRGKSVGSSC